MLKRLEYIPYVVTVKEEVVVEKKVSVLDNIHEIRAALRAKATEKLQAVLHSTDKYKKLLEQQEKEQAYQKKLVEVGAIGMTQDEQKALQASKEYEETMRAIDQLDPSKEEHQEQIAKILDAGQVKEMESNKAKILEHMSPGLTIEDKNAVLQKRIVNKTQKLPDEK